MINRAAVNVKKTVPKMAALMLKSMLQKINIFNQIFFKSINLKSSDGIQINVAVNVPSIAQGFVQAISFSILKNVLVNASLRKRNVQEIRNGTKNYVNANVNILRKLANRHKNGAMWLAIVFVSQLNRH